MGIGHQHDLIGFVPGFEHKRTTADGSLGAGGPGRAIFLDSVNRRELRKIEQGRQIGGGPLGRDGQGVVVNGTDTQILDRNFARDHGLPIFDGVVIPLEVIAGFGVGPDTEGAYIVVGRDRSAIGEDQFRTKIEIPRQPVVTDLPVGGRCRQQIEVPVHAQQRLGEKIGAVDIAVAGHRLVHVFVILLQGTQDLYFRWRRVGRQLNPH